MPQKKIDIGMEIWDRKYRYHGSKSIPEDKTVDDTWHRVARTAAANEKNSKYWETAFLEILSDYKFLPGGRILANAGTDRREVTMFNCYVMNTIEDSIEGIFNTVKDSALTQKQGGGVGFDFSTLRPAGSPIKGCEAKSSGPISFMQVMDSTCRTIMSAGQRRGAQMAVMRCDHPDIQEFITAKRHNANLQMFNLSVAITEKFIDAVKNNEQWELVFNGLTYKTVRAVELWELIMKSTYDFAEPGFILIDKINEMNNLYYCEEIRATNPCIPADTWVQTDQGARQVYELIGKPFNARINGVDFPSGYNGFFKTATKEIVKINTMEGYSLRLTSEHQLQRIIRLTRNIIKTEWCEAGKLNCGDRLLLNNHYKNFNWKGKYSWDEGYLIGLLVGDGTLKTDSAIKELALELKMLPGRKNISPEIEKASSEFYRGFLRGLFDADGSVQETQQKGVSIRLAQSNLNSLEAVQRMLLRLSIVSRIYKNRRNEGFKFLPNGKKGNSQYHIKAQHELIISGENLRHFSEIIGFSNTDKEMKLKQALVNYTRKLNKERFTAHVESVSFCGIEEVFDVQIPEINSFDANGFVAHNCGEQPLPPYGACLLGSLNLTKFVSNPFTNKAELDFKQIESVTKTAVRFLDNVIDISGYPLPQQKKEARNKRRMGIGIMGLADMLIFMGVRYGSPKSIEIASEIMKAITYTAYRASISLAKEKGVFPLFDAENYCKGRFITTLPGDIQKDIRKYGLRNSHLTSIAPTGTISLFAGNISSGLEPVFAFSYKRKIRNSHENDSSEVNVTDYAYHKYIEHIGKKVADSALPKYFVTCDMIAPQDHVEIQAALQKHVDSSISKTINIPADYPFEDFKNIYMLAYQKGLKGCTTFRPSEQLPGVLIKEDVGKDKSPNQTQNMEITMPKIAGRPKELEGTTYKIKTPLSPDAIYVTINDIIEEKNGRRPYELFINTKNLQHFSWVVAMTRLISAVFRKEPDPTFLVEELKSIYDPNGGYFSDGRYIPSLAADIGLIIEKHLRKIGIMGKKESSASGQEKEKVKKTTRELSKFMICPQCKERGLYSQENCLKCINCGYSKCG